LCRCWWKNSCANKEVELRARRQTADPAKDQFQTHRQEMSADKSVMPTKIKVALYASGRADQQGHMSVLRQMRICQAAAAKAGWIVPANVSECKKKTTTLFGEGGRHPTRRNQ
jgi:hypothetical protein